MNSLLRAKKFLYNNKFFKGLCPYREILKRAHDPNFWDDPKNNSFVELVDNKIKEIEKKIQKTKNA
jgi:hypothetical protein